MVDQEARQQSLASWYGANRGDGTSNGSPEEEQSRGSVTDQHHWPAAHDLLGEENGDDDTSEAAYALEDRGNERLLNAGHLEEKGLQGELVRCFHAKKTSRDEGLWYLLRIRSRARPQTMSETEPRKSTESTGEDPSP